MSFLNRLNEITKPKVKEAKFDFGFGDGEETVIFRAMKYADRKRIFQSRMTDKGTNEKGETLRGLDTENFGLEINSEVLEACFITPEGKPVATKDAYMKEWDADLVDSLAMLCMNTIGSAKKPEDGEDEDPSKGQS